MRRKKRTTKSLEAELIKTGSFLQAVWFATSLYEAVAEGDIQSADADELWARWRQLITAREWKDMANQRADSAISLAAYPGTLIYEDAFKLACTVHEMGVLEHVGFALDEQLRTELASALKKRFRKDHGMTRQAMERFRTQWNWDWWYYSI